MEDIEMDSHQYDSQKSSQESDIVWTYLVIDTNVALDCQDAIKQFMRDAEQAGLSLTVVIPSKVIRELDRHKNLSDRKKAWSARTAARWILEAVEARKDNFKVQATRETADECYQRTNEDSDGKILCCALYFKRLGRPFVLSGDKFFCARCRADDVETPTAADISRLSSRALAKQLFPGSSSKNFTGYYPDYNGDSVIIRPDKEEPMEVDMGEVNLSQHRNSISEEDAKKSFHLKIVDDITFTLAALVTRVNKVNPRLLTINSLSKSIHAAPALTDEPENQDFARWTAAQLIAHLERRKRVLPSMTASLGGFLTKPYKARSGARTIAEWSSADWRECLAALETLATAWEDEPLETLLRSLLCPFNDIFQDFH
ncbi:hypothetical protein VNI00_000164 [Paramarasmius palmivorus]|uniref:PIN domain-containing protein n=1 Tax=Paramarasmius palmivorus TaxID=297713 RepID=A0AAW0EG98_9AGAR